MNVRRQAWSPHTNTVDIVLENLCAPFHHACVLDLKIGQKGIVEGETEAKSARRRIKGAVSGAAEYGFRVSGLRVFRPADNAFFVRDQKSRFGERVGRAHFIEALELFLFNGVRIRTDVVTPFVRRLEELRTAIATQARVDFLASSLLLIYEGHPTKEAHVDVRMIDFDHAQLRPTGSVPRDGVLIAIASLLRLLQRIARMTSHSQSLADLSILRAPAAKGEKRQRDEERRPLHRSNSEGAEAHELKELQDHKAKQHAGHEGKLKERDERTRK